MTDSPSSPRTTRCHPSLPVFRLDAAGRSILYALGRLVVVQPSMARTIENAWRAKGGLPAGGVSRTAAALADAATLAVEERRRRLAAPFRPVCLTVYLSNRCNLACAYCYSAAAGRSADSPVIDERAIRAAALVVAENCRVRAETFWLVIHGGGEPSLHPGTIERVVALTRRMAAETGVDWFGYIATNGVMPAHRARWLAGMFDLIGLSCDGPPDIHDRQRPTMRGTTSARRVETTADAIHAAGGRFVARATVTPISMYRQMEIVDYVHSRLGAAELRLEPMYRTGHEAGAGFLPGDAEAFVQHYLAAEHRASQLGLPIGISGARPDELHGPHCAVLKDVLQITPDGTAVACFLHSDGRQACSQSLDIGRWDPESDVLVLDQERITHLRALADAVPQECHDCINAYHCARDCPEVCYALGASSSLLAGAGASVTSVDGFRCRVQRLLAEHWILQAAGVDPSRHGNQVRNLAADDQIAEGATEPTGASSSAASIPGGQLLASHSDGLR